MKFQTLYLRRLLINFFSMNEPVNFILIKAGMFRGINSERKTIEGSAGMFLIASIATMTGLMFFGEPTSTAFS